MKKTGYRFNRNSIIAGILATCVVVVNIPLTSFAYYNCEEPDGELRVEYEDHDMETYLADGKYDGTDSSYEISNSGDDTIESYETIYHFNILEIVRGEGLATFGYSLDGYEPVPGDTPEMKHACMDALMNRITGGDQNETKDERPYYINNFMTQFSDGDKVPFSTEFGEYTGYYKWVGEGKGFYSVIKNTLSRSNHRVKMVSKFCTDWVNSDRKNDYIWVDVDSSLSVSDLEASDTVDHDKDIIVSNHRKNKYINNEVFYKNFYTTEGSVDDWKKTHKVNLRTRVCTEVSLDDIEWADFIYLTNGNGVYAQSAYEVYKVANPGRSFPDRNNLPPLNLPTFRHTLAIYDRIAVREDAAILVDGKDSFTGGKISTNYMKLIAMLFLVNNIRNDYGHQYGSGRDMFMDYIKTYVANGKAPGLRTTAVSNSMNGLTAENGFMYQDFPRTQVGRNDWHDDTASELFDNNGQLKNGEFYFQKSKSNTTDYIYINEDNGNFMVDNKYSGKVYWVDYEIYNSSGKKDGFAHRYVSWTRQSDKLGGSSYNNRSEWPWDIVEGACLKYWWVAKDVTDQQAHLPLYFQYYSNDDYSWGPYRAISDPVQGTFKNQSFTNENGAFKGNLVKDAIAGRPVKREYTDPTHGELQSGTPKYFFLSANIKNGDGVNKTHGGNKVLYVNDYEIRDGLITSLPINFEIRTSENISKIEVLDNSGSVILSYQPPTPNTNDITKPEAPLKFTGSSNIELENKTVYTTGEGDSRKPDKQGPHNLYIYTFSDSIDGKKIKLDSSKFNSGTNNKFTLRIWVQPVEGGEAKHVDDELFVVKRGFFSLD